MPCNANSCEGGLSCCVPIDYYPNFYCKIASQCHQQPVWQVIAIPSMLIFFSIVLSLMIWLKLRGKRVQKRDIRSYAYEQIRVKPQPSLQIKNRTYTTVPSTINSLNNKNKHKSIQILQNHQNINNMNTFQELSSNSKF